MEMQGDARLELVLPAAPRTLAAVRLSIVGFARGLGAAEECLQAVAIAVNEAAANVVVHAYAGEGERPLRVAADADHGRLVVTVSDEGAGGALDPRGDGEGGRGLPLMQALADDVEVHRSPGGTTARLTFALSPRAA